MCIHVLGLIRLDWMTRGDEVVETRCTDGRRVELRLFALFFTVEMVGT